MSSNIAQTCSGVDGHTGQACACRRHCPNPKLGPDDPQTCKNCGHWDTCHPMLDEKRSVSKVEEILKMYKPVASAFKSSTSLKATMDEAVGETNAGLKGSSKDSSRFQGSNTSGGQQKVKASTRVRFTIFVIPKWLIHHVIQAISARSETELSSQQVKFGRLVMIPVGIVR
jgi:hypothetical protein